MGTRDGGSNIASVKSMEKEVVGVETSQAVSGTVVMTVDQATYT